MTQAAAVRAALLDGAWRTKAQISALADAPEHSVAARLSEINRHPDWTVERRCVNGRNEYRAVRKPRPGEVGFDDRGLCFLCDERLPPGLPGHFRRHVECVLVDVGGGC